MEIIDCKAAEVSTFIASLDEMLANIQSLVKNHNSPLNGEKYLTNREVCRMLQVSPRTLQKWRNEKMIPFSRLKGKILYRESDIVAWLSTRAV
ncbi:MAG: helix-turn-helix domain-containing protein [Dysgonamonadaceae bacterium]|jgi:excisionase family DNA binding protein|nr:helix-turn-helix domain-containing protein [Dysgonamonadaceae bacterium]